MKKDKVVNIKRRRGSTVLADVFILCVSLLIITITTMFMVNILTPFIYYQKLQMTSQKYMYIFEKYGSLKTAEINEMYSELEKQGFERNKLSIKCTAAPLTYGQEIIFEVKYIYIQKIPTLNTGIVLEDKNIELNVRKVSIAKN